MLRNIVHQVGFVYKMQKNVKGGKIRFA